MSKTADLLFEYLRDLLYNPERATLDIDNLDEEYRMLGEGLLYFGKCVRETADLARALSKGNLSVKLPPPGNELASSLKALHAALKHMTWQSQQVAKGDYQQRIDFMGEFAEAFNTMTRQLEQRQRALEAEVESGREKTLALERSNSLLEAITDEIQQWIIVVDGNTQEILFTNRIAQTMLDKSPAVLEDLRLRLPPVEDPNAHISQEWEFELNVGEPDGPSYFSAVSYPIRWREHDATAYVLSDISTERRHVQKLENYAYQDTLTGMHNRFYGMQVLREWLAEKREFCIGFADLDNLKYVNDNFGHSEGDRYIIFAASLLRNFSTGAVSCRLGGDEFMVLAPGMDRKACEERMWGVRTHMLENKEEGRGRYLCSLSYGVVEVREDEKLTASELLAIADERMYAFKRSHKAGRGQMIPT